MSAILFNRLSEVNSNLGSFRLDRLVFEVSSRARAVTLTSMVSLSERLQQERQQALEKMGISVQDSGIMVEKNKYYLVNLNADPSLNELLVYYLKVRSSRRFL